MLEAKNDFHFAYLTLKSIISFQLRILINSVLRGHFLLKSNINNYLKKNKKPKLHLGSSNNLNGFFNSQILGKNQLIFQENFLSKIILLILYFLLI